jgi:hypothetical protein
MIIGFVGKLTNSNKRTKMMKALIVLTLIALSFALLGSISQANELPPIPEGGLRTVYEMECSDQETGETGYCFIREDVEGNTYWVFAQNDVVMFIQRVIPSGYETIWMHDRYDSY